MKSEAIRKELIRQIAHISVANFDEIALEVFRYQATFNPLYEAYLKLLKIKPAQIKSLDTIPFLPISFFKTHAVKTGEWVPEAVFTSSGTSGRETSRHYVRDLAFYLHNTQRGFEHFFGDLSQYCFLALLPSYLERTGSSLITMTAHFIQQSKYPQSGFFLQNIEELIGILKDCKKNKIPTVLLGVSFALLDIAEKYKLDLDGIIVMETGGFKGRRKELIRSELHEILCQAMMQKAIASEFGMTEMMSQCYSKKDGIFYVSPTVKILIREITDPFSPEKTGRPGVMNIIDIANIDTISFLASDDIGLTHDNHGEFGVLGRVSDQQRGCNLLLQEISLASE